MQQRILGLTGNIGAGKTTIAGVMEKVLGIPVIRADQALKDMVAEGDRIIREVDKILGPGIYDKDGKFSWLLMRQTMFASPALEEAFRTRISPLVWMRIKRDIISQSKPIVCVENALLYENGQDKHCNHVICVWCAEDVAVRRIVKDRGYSEEMARARFRMQMPVTEKIARASVAFNTSSVSLETLERDMEGLLRQVRKCLGW